MPRIMPLQVSDMNEAAGAGDRGMGAGEVPPDGEDASDAGRPGRRAEGVVIERVPAQTRPERIFDPVEKDRRHEHAETIGALEQRQSGLSIRASSGTAAATMTSGIRLMKRNRARSDCL